MGAPSTICHCEGDPSRSSARELMPERTFAFTPQLDCFWVLSLCGSCGPTYRTSCSGVRCFYRAFLGRRSAWGLFALTTLNRAPYHHGARRKYLSNTFQFFGSAFSHPNRPHCSLTPP